LKPLAKGISAWGIVSLVLLLGEVAFGEYNLYRTDHHRTPLVAWAVSNQVCVVIQLAAVVCGVIATRRGSKWWTLTVVPAFIIAVICYFGDL
jgi:hypothetical protein